MSCCVLYSAGLSSILDLSDGSTNSQRSLFPGDQWKLITDSLTKKLSFLLGELPRSVLVVLILSYRTYSRPSLSAFMGIHKLYVHIRGFATNEWLDD